ncbi:MAG: alkane 1-monooxygenase [Rudaea sp.]|uniref:alkane 1-monooxygenase n=1 Tax=Rudaea sp. TaxID=2136325 RepID=UPI0039E2977E
MVDYLKYYVAPFTQALALWGLLMGGHYVWIAIAWLPALAILDAMLPTDLAARKIRSRSWALVPVWLSCLLGPAIYVAFAWSLAHNVLTPVQIAGAIIGVAWMSVLPLVPASHELYHGRNPIGKTVGRYVQVCYLDSTRMEAHVVGHHIFVATVDDTDTAARGETIYSFSPRAVWKTTIEAQQFISDALAKKGYARWSIRHALWRAILVLVLFLGALFWIGGVKALLCSLAAMVIARFWIETFNYFQHYGQVRVVGSPIEKRHVWNHLGPLSRMTAFEITNHADHHLNTYQPFYALVPHREAIRMPSVFLCFFAALVPPLWFNRIIKPALKEWDLNWANGEERKLAAAQNRKAGWEDWFGDSAGPTTSFKAA